MEQTTDHPRAITAIANIGRTVWRFIRWLVAARETILTVVAGVVCIAGVALSLAASFELAYILTTLSRGM